MDAKLLISQIATDVAHFLTLKDLLTRERDALATHDFEKFRDVLEEKHALLRVLDANQHARTEALTALGITPNRQGIDTFLDANADAEQQAHWHQLSNLVHECKEMNEVNARINHRARLTNSHLLNILTGGEGSPSLYNPQGKADADPTKRSIEA